MNHGLRLKWGQGEVSFYGRHVSLVAGLKYFNNATKLEFYKNALTGHIHRSMIAPIQNFSNL